MPRYESILDMKVWRKAVAHLKRQDKVLAKLIGRYGILEEGMGKWSWNSYEAVIRSFIYQQISGAAGDSILKRFEALFNGKLPNPKQFLKTPMKKIRAAGISPQKYSYIKDFCERLESGQLDLDSLKDLPDEEIIAILDEVKGIGRWTAEMFLMSSLHRVDVFAADDLGLRNAIKRVYGLKSDPNKATLERITNKWRPYRSIGAIYLWRSQDGGE